MPFIGNDSIFNFNILVRSVVCEHFYSIQLFVIDVLGIVCNNTCMVVGGGDCLTKFKENEQFNDWRDSEKWARQMNKAK